jgi:hypothetical protein
VVAAAGQEQWMLLRQIEQVADAKQPMLRLQKEQSQLLLLKLLLKYK